MGVGWCCELIVLLGCRCCFVLLACCVGGVVGSGVGAFGCCFVVLLGLLSLLWVCVLRGVGCELLFSCGFVWLLATFVVR